MHVKSYQSPYPYYNAASAESNVQQMQPTEREQRITQGVAKELLIRRDIHVLDEETPQITRGARAARKIYLKLSENIPRNQDYYRLERLIDIVFVNSRHVLEANIADLQDIQPTYEFLLDWLTKYERQRPIEECLTMPIHLSPLENVVRQRELQKESLLRQKEYLEEIREVIKEIPFAIKDTQQCIEDQREKPKDIVEHIREVYSSLPADCKNPRSLSVEEYISKKYKNIGESCSLLTNLLILKSAAEYLGHWHMAETIKQAQKLLEEEQRRGFKALQNTLLNLDHKAELLLEKIEKELERISSSLSTSHSTKEPALVKKVNVAMGATSFLCLGALVAGIVLLSFSVSPILTLPFTLSVALMALGGILMETFTLLSFVI